MTKFDSSAAETLKPEDFDQEVKNPPKRRSGRPKIQKKFPPNKMKKASEEEPVLNITENKLEIEESVLAEYIGTLSSLYARYTEAPTIAQLFKDFMAEYGLEDDAEGRTKKIFDKILSKSGLSISAENEEILDVRVQEISPEKIEVKDVVEGPATPSNAENTPKRIVKIMYQGEITDGWAVMNINPKNGNYLVQRNVGTDEKPKIQALIVSSQDILKLNDEGMAIAGQEVKATEEIAGDPVAPVEPEVKFEETPLGKEIDAVLEVAGDEVHERYVEEQKGIFSRFMAMFRRKDRRVTSNEVPKNEIEQPEQIKPKFVPGNVVSIWHNGRVTKGWRISEILPSGEYLFRIPSTGQEHKKEYKFKFSDVEMWSNQVKAEDVAGAKKMKDLIAIVEKTGGIMGSNQYYTAKNLKEVLEFIMGGGHVSSITRAAGLREKVYELMTKQGAKYEQDEIGRRIN